MKPAMRAAHLWRKSGTDDSSGRIMRVWTCKHCGAAKRRVTKKQDAAPRTAIEKTVSSEVCR